MKLNQHFAPLCLAAACCLGTAAGSLAAAPWSPPVGVDVCWKHVASNSLIRVRFIAVGPAYYQFVGKLVESTGLINPLFGSFVVTPAALLGTSTHSGSSAANYWGEIGNLSINRTTKVLTFKAIGVERVSPAPYYTSVNATLVACL